MRLFDAYLAVDWSARRSPAPKNETANAVWVGELLVDDDLGVTSASETYFRTRWACSQHLHSRLADHASQGRRVFVGFDVAYGYPAGFADACGLGAGQRWRLVWDELHLRIEDRPDGWANHFQAAGELNDRMSGAKPGPFWGCPKGETIPGLMPTSPRFPFLSRSGHALDRLRETERRLRGVLPTWQLFGAGAVGSQTLVGIPAVARLRDAPGLQQISRVWPFETGFGLHPISHGAPGILHAEIWPGVVGRRFAPKSEIKDKAEVKAMVEWLATLDRNDALLPLFGRPSGLSDDHLQVIVEQEGWILGSGLQNGAGA